MLSKYKLFNTIYAAKIDINIQAKGQAGNI